MQLPQYSIGLGDRFEHQAEAQLAACLRARDAGALVAPVWNKSNREHTIIHSEPVATRKAADAAVAALGWHDPYFCDADHIGVATVERFLAPCDFFTLDVAEQIGEAASTASLDDFVHRHTELTGTLHLEGVAPFTLNEEFVRKTAAHYLAAVEQARRIYDVIVARKGEGSFVTEVSMDETNAPQTPAELLIILAAVADHAIPIQTIAPKFTGRFNKGVDYVGDLTTFSREFSEDMAVIAHAVRQYGLPSNLKLSVHSGSDKFSLYAPIREAMLRTGAGVHLKTAGTTWLEEVSGLAEAGGDGLALAKEIYAEAYAHRDELCGPYATVIDIDPAQLPDPEQVNAWNSKQFVEALRHRDRTSAYNASLRQLLHVGFKVAAKMGSRYTSLLEEHKAIVAASVTDNLYKHHIAPLFVGDGGSQR